MGMKIDPAQTKEALADILKARLVPMIHGSPAIGKSSVVKQVAEEFGMKVIDVRLTQCDPTDLN